MEQHPKLLGFFVQLSLVQRHLDTAPVLRHSLCWQCCGSMHPVSTALQDVPGDAFSYSESYIEGDATPSKHLTSSGVVTSLPMLSNTTTTSGGVAGSLAGTIASDGAMTITAGGAGTTGNRTSGSEPEIE